VRLSSVAPSSLPTSRLRSLAQSELGRLAAMAGPMVEPMRASTGPLVGLRPLGRSSRPSVEERALRANSVRPLRVVVEGAEQVRLGPMGPAEPPRSAATLAGEPRRLRPPIHSVEVVQELARPLLVQSTAAAAVLVFRLTV
jgi:hypothetical protein